MTRQPARPAEMAKAYEPQQIEARLYEWWESCGFFAPRPNPAKKPFVMSMPPPNVTGELHVGHAMFVTIEDVMTRWHRMRGEQTLWLPGTDHAGIATQLQVERLLRSEGTSREEVGREAFVARTWGWVEHYGGEITTQLRRIGASCDWSRERFTLDPGLSRAVRTAFKRLYDDGLIYRGLRLVNWSPNLQTAVSDVEVEYQDRDVSMYHIRYPVLDSNNEYITVATTRPETMMGDTAVAVNPEDPRYKHLIGRTVLLPAVNRPIPIIADEYADPAFGTGAVKITPAHDPNDYLVAQRHGLPMINVMNKDATLNENAGPYAGMERFAARKAVLADLERDGLLVETRPHKMSVGIAQRGGEVIEPLLSEQWFVRTKPMAELALAAVKEGKTRIVPERMEKVYFHWMENIEDWCISRQLWWGHRIPVWYAPDGSVIVPGPDDPDPQGEGITQDPDVLDTWFSSGLWPFSTLGWPDDTPDMRAFYPTSVLETGYDILFFWVARMMMLGCYLTDQPPFHTIYLHGLVRDKDGRKMSKTYGNVVNPLEVMEQYGTDALRFTLTTSSTPGQDTNLNPERIESSRNFANKIWNITRFVLSKLDLPKTKGETTDHGPRTTDHGPRTNVESLVSNEPDDVSSLVPSAALRAGLGLSSNSDTLADRWILSRYARLVENVDRLMTAYNFGEAGRQIQEFLWSEFADWYVEVAKIQIDTGDAAQQARTRKILFSTLEGTLRLLHPFMPYVTEEAWQYLTDGGRWVVDHGPQTTDHGPRLALSVAEGTTDPEASANGQAALSDDYQASGTTPSSVVGGPSSAAAAATIMLAPYPQPGEIGVINEQAEREWALIQALIVGVRNVRNEHKVEPARWVAAQVAAGARAGLVDGQRAVISRLARVADDQFTVAAHMAEKPKAAAVVVIEDIELVLPLAGLIDLQAERARLAKELADTEADVARRSARLSNESFVGRAPANVVQKERDGLAAAEASVAKLRARLAELA